MVQYTLIYIGVAVHCVNFEVNKLVNVNFDLAHFTSEKPINVGLISNNNSLKNDR